MCNCWPQGPSFRKPLLVLGHPGRSHLTHCSCWAVICHCAFVREAHSLYASPAWPTTVGALAEHPAGTWLCCGGGEQARWWEGCAHLCLGTHHTTWALTPAEERSQVPWDVAVTRLLLPSPPHTVVPFQKGCLQTWWGECPDTVWDAAGVDCRQGAPAGPGTLLPEGVNLPPQRSFVIAGLQVMEQVACCFWMGREASGQEWRWLSVYPASLQ